MATVFYDHLIPWHKVERYLVAIQPTADEKWELLEVIEETVHTQVLTLVLEHIPQTSHDAFLERFHAAPHAEEHLVFIKSACTDDVEAIISMEMDRFIDELITSLQTLDAE